MTLTELDIALETIARLGARREPEVDHQSIASHFEREVIRLEAENERLRKGIQDYLDGNYEPRIKKMDKCHHGTYGYEICEACTDEHFAKLLAVQQ